MTMLPNKWNTIRRYSKDIQPQEHALRAYSNAPGEIAIQIRTDKAYGTAILSLTQARLFAQMISDAIDKNGRP